jgi:hypothetical protein
MRRVVVFAVPAIAALIVSGCGAPPSSTPAAKTDQAKGPGPKPPPLPPGPVQAVPGGSPATQPASPDVVHEKAVVGVGKKGRDYGPGLITTPLSVYFRAPQMMVFNIQIPDAMNKYRGVNGHFPKSEKEFMEKIIKENEIQLPELPGGERYFYDAERAAQMRTYDSADPPLMVVKPK